MIDEHLGLFDTPPNRMEQRIGMMVVGLMAIVAVLVLPFSSIELSELDAFIPMICAMIFTGDLIIASLLFAQATVFGSRGLIVLASGFVVIALLLFAYVLTFPGAYAPDGLLGAGTNSAAWLIIFRRIGFPLFIIFYVLLRKVDDRTRIDVERLPSLIIAASAAAVGSAALLTVLATAGHDLLPPMFVDSSLGHYSNLLIFNLVLIGVVLAAITILFLHRQSVLDMWLLVALAGWLVHGLLNLAITERFSLGWYSLQLLTLFSILSVLLALLMDSNRLYARLAMASVARNLERDARLMSMEAVASSISHEVRQPLAAVSLNALASLNWLTRDRPNVEKAVESIGDVIESARRSSEIMKSVRAIFSNSPGSLSEFSVNDLVRETIDLMRGQLATAKVTLSLSLDNDLPAIVANRVQIHQVVLNLILNAIESLVPAKPRRRRIWIRAIRQDGDKLLLEVTDNGSGITAESMPHLFKAFHTTKATGTGMGLSLCRTIVEEHGGAIWASPREKGGAIFHVLLPYVHAASETRLAAGSPT